MIRIGAKWRINLGMLGLMTSTLLLAVSIGFVPDHRHATLKGRSKLCEALAVNSSVLVSRGDKRNLALVFETTVARNDDLLSAAVRDRGGKLVAVVADHTSRWEDLPRVRRPTRRSVSRFGIRPRAGNGVRRNSVFAPWWPAV